MSTKRPFPAPVLPVRETSPGAPVAAGDLRVGEIGVNSADGTLYVRKEDGTVVPVGAGSTAPIVSSGAVADLTAEQIESVSGGSVVTTTDGRRWVYSGQGSKTAEASYIELADITPAWASIPDKPATFTPATHGHGVSDVSGLQSALDGKQAAGSYAAASHTHTLANVTGLQSALDGKQATLAAGVDGGEVLTYVGGQGWIGQQPSSGSLSAAVEWTVNHTLADGTRYEVGDLVYAGGNLYRAIAANESMPVSATEYWTLVGAGYRLNIDGRDIPNLPAELPASANEGDVLTYTTGTWTAVASSGGGGEVYNWQGYWNSSTQYAINDAVIWRGATYVLYNNPNFYGYQPHQYPEYWRLIGQFSPGSGGTWEPSDGNALVWSSQEQQWIPGSVGGGGSSVFRGEWSGSASYSTGDFVEYSGVIYKNVNPFNNPTPGTDPNYWLPIGGGGGGGGTSSWKGEWSSSESYTYNDVVTYSQALYIAVNTSNGTAPGTDGGSYWMPLTGGGGGGSGLPSSPADGVLTVYSSGQMGWRTSDDSMALQQIVLGSFGSGSSSRAIVSFSPSDTGGPSIKVYDSVGMAFTELMSTGIKFADGTTQGSAFGGGYSGNISINDGTVTHYFEFSNGVLTGYYTS